MTTVTCTRCRQPLPAEARFCPSCGTPRPTTHPVHADERRVATVVIGDVVAFTGLAERLDPEAVKLLVDRLFGRLAADVTSHGGTVDKVVGDAIVALFGAPVAHEDDPERAVRAALAMQRTVAEVAREMGLPLQMRFGVNSGEVLVGGLAAGDAYTAMGDAVNVASRLEEAAPPGTVLVGPETREATRTTVTYRRHGSTRVRGRSQPVETWIAEAAIGIPGDRRSAATGPAIGRAVEGRLLDALLDVVVARQRAHMVEVSGDAGVGKRRLVQAFTDRARTRHDAIVIEGRIPPYGEASPWGPAADMLRGALGGTKLVDPEALAVAVAELLDEPADADRPVEIARALTSFFEHDDPTATSDRARAGASAAVVTLLGHLARERPVLCVLTNIQWADNAILELLTDVLVGLRRTPVMAITTSRGDHAGHEELAEEILAHVDGTWLRLAPLDDAAATMLARQLLGPDAAEAAVAEAVRRSGGNPLMLEEIAALATDRGGRDVGSLPMTLRGLMSARLDELDGPARRLVEDAPMIGHTGPVALLADIATDRGEASPSVVLEGLVDAHLFVIDGPRFRFRTDALREAAYLRLPKAERATRHRDIGRRLADPRWATANAVRRRAQHLATAAELAGSIASVDPTLVAEAVTALVDAARWASGRDPGLALEMAERALDLGGDDVHEARLLRAAALAALARFDQARDAAEALLATDVGGPLRVQARVVVGQVLQTQGRLAESAAVLSQAVEEAAAGDDGAVHAHALRMAAQTCIFRGDDEGARRLAEQAMAAYEVIQDGEGVAWTWLQLGWVAFNTADLGTADAMATRARPVLHAAGDVMGVGLSDCLRGWIQFLLGNLDPAREHAESALVQVVPPEAAGFGNGLARTLLACVALWEGRTTTALEEAAQATALLDAVGHRWAHMLALLVQARALAHAGRPDAARAAVEEGLGMAGSLEVGVGQAFVGQAAAATLLHLGHPDDAAPLLVDTYQGAGAPNRERMCALVALQQGRPADAAGHARASLDSAPTESIAAANAGVAALALARAGEPPAEVEAQVAAVLDSARATFQDRAMALLARAVVAARSGEHGTVEDALLAAEAELETVEDAPMRALVALAHRLLAEPEAGPDRTPDGPADASGLLGPGWLVALASEPAGTG